MQPWEAFRILLFFAAIAVTCLKAGQALWRLARRSRGGPPLARADQGALALGLAGALCVLYGWRVEPYWPQVVRVRLSSPKLRAATRPLRVVQVSDLHCDPFPRLEERLPAIVAALGPDAIVFTGDALNSRDALPVFRRLIGRLAAIAPTFAVRGNWDTRIVPGMDLFGGTGARELAGDAVRLQAAGAELWLAGVAVDEEQGMRGALEQAPAAAFRVFLHHYPDWIDEVSVRGADLYLAGHTHGGQVALPLYGAIVTLSRFGKRFESGLHRVRGTWLYVNRGIGMEGGRAPRVRFCARPEITLFELSAE